MKITKFLLLHNEAIILKGHNFSVESACNYIETNICDKQDIEMFNSERPNRLITNLIMPKMNGVEICRKIKARHPDIEAILVTGSPDEIKKHLQEYHRVEGNMPFLFKEDTKEDIIAKRNCWEVKNCGREPEGVNADELGICPAATEQRLDRIHGGENAGRSCWVVAGSMCGGKRQGTYAEKYADCMKCDFYMKVKSEENSNFRMTASLLIKLQPI